MRYVAAYAALVGIGMATGWLVTVIIGVMT